MTTYTKEQLVEQLREGEMVVHFTKLDGDVRIMNCTLNTDLIPEENRPKGSTKEPSEKQQANLSVYDLTANGWRSFKVDRVFDFQTVDEAHEQVMDALKESVRYYLVRVWGYGGEGVWGTLEKETIEYWTHEDNKDRFEEYVFDPENYVEEHDNMPRHADFLRLEDDEDHTPWYEFDNLLHGYGSAFYSSNITIEHVESEEYNANVIETIVDGEKLEEWPEEAGVTVEMGVHEIDTKGHTHVLSCYSSEKGCFFEGVIAIRNGKKFDPSKLTIYTMEYPNGDDMIESIVYDGVDIENNGGDTNGKGMYAGIIEW